MKRPTTKAKAKGTSAPRTGQPKRVVSRGPTARHIDDARREIWRLLLVARYLACGPEENETLLERIDAALDALR